MLCGITCLQMICKYYGAYLKLNYLQELCQEGREGISLAALKQGTESLGLECLCGFANTKELSSSLPCILHWNQNHFVVLYKVKKGRLSTLPTQGKDL